MRHKKWLYSSLAVKFQKFYKKVSIITHAIKFTLNVWLVRYLLRRVILRKYLLFMQRFDVIVHIAGCHQMSFGLDASFSDDMMQRIRQQRDDHVR